MKNFDRINRRTHLYLGLFLLPWMLMYGASSFIISHHAWFRSDQQPSWEMVFDREYQRPINDQADLRETAREILKDCHLDGAFWVQRPNSRELQINRFRFLDETRLTYLVKEHRLRAERQRMRWDQAVLRMHFRGGFIQTSFWNDLWAIVVDVVCVGILIWIASGLIMFWRLGRLRAWGALAIGGGILSFVWLIWTL